MGFRVVHFAAVGRYILCFLVTHEPFFFFTLSFLLVIIKLKYLIGGFGATVSRQREGVMIA